MRGDEVKTLAMGFHRLLECGRYLRLLRSENRRCFELLTQRSDFVVKALLKLRYQFWDLTMCLVIPTVYKPDFNPL